MKKGTSVVPITNHKLGVENKKNGSWTGQDYRTGISGGSALGLEIENISKIRSIH